MMAGWAISTFPPNLDDSFKVTKTISTDRHEGHGVDVDDGFDEASCINVHHGLLRVCSFDILDRWGLRERLLSNGVKNLTAIGDSLGKKLRANRFNLKPEGPADHSFDQWEPDPG